MVANRTRLVFDLVVKQDIVAEFSARHALLATILGHWQTEGSPLAIGQDGMHDVVRKQDSNAASVRILGKVHAVRKWTIVTNRESVRLVLRHMDETPI